MQRWVLVILGQNYAHFFTIMGLSTKMGLKTTWNSYFLLWVYCLELQSPVVLTISFMNILFKKKTAINGIFVNSELHRTERGSRKATDLLRLKRRKRRGDYRSPNINWISCPFVHFFILSFLKYFSIVFFTGCGEQVEADNIMLKERKLNIAPAIKKQVRPH